jgi:hypothetical protein
MSKQLDGIDDELKVWIGRQHVFFVASAPSGSEGHVNCSPKGGDCFRVLGPNEVAYQDYTGSGAETAAHLRENGRIVVMFCAFEGNPLIVRLHGAGEIVTPEDARFEELTARFPHNAGTRAIVLIHVGRVSTSCGFSVPQMRFEEPRDTLDRWAESKGSEGLADYRRRKNTVSIDGLPALEG